jgi:hypothetical protein
MSSTDDSERPEFSVCEFFSNDTHCYVEPRWLPPKEAVELAKRMVDRNDPFVDKIIITDGGDNTVFQWERGKGITWPKKGVKNPAYGT